MNFYSRSRGMCRWWWQAPSAASSSTRPPRRSATIHCKNFLQFLRSFFHKLQSLLSSAPSSKFLSFAFFYFHWCEVCCCDCTRPSVCYHRLARAPVVTQGVHHIIIIIIVYIIIIITGLPWHIQDMYFVTVAINNYCNHHHPQQHKHHQHQLARAPPLVTLIVQVQWHDK